MVWVLEGVQGLGSTGVVPGPGVYVSYHHVFKCRTPGGYSWGLLVGVCRRVPLVLILFQTKKCHFSHPFSDQTSKIHTSFQIWPLGRNYVIIT